MPGYAYKAVTAANELVSGTLSADSPADARAWLRRRGLHIAECRELRANPLVLLPRLVNTRRPQALVAELARHLALLLRSGVSVVEAVGVLIHQQSGRFQAILMNLKERVSEGSTFADALARHPHWFDPIFVNSVRVGETSGSLDEALLELSEYLGDRQMLRAKLSSALLYPCLLLLLGTGVVVFLMSFVIPKLLTVLTASGRPLPGSTLFLKTLSDLLIGHWFLLLMAAVCVGVTLTLVLNTGRGRYAWQYTQLRIPLLGPLIKKSIAAEFAQMMAMLLRSGVPFVEAVTIVSHMTRSTIVQRELSNVKTAVEAGSDIGPSFVGSMVFPPLLVHLVDVGQRTGELIEMLARLKEGYETEVKLALEKFTAALEPLLIIVLAGIIGFIVFATMTPILEATRIMQL